MSDIYLSLTETPTVVTLSQPVVSGVLSSNVTVTNVVSVNVVTMPAINVTAAVSGGLTDAELRASAVSVAVTTMPALSISSVSISNFPATQTVAGTVTANVFGYNYEEQGGALIPVKLDVGDYNYIPIGPSVDPIPLPISGSVTIGSLPAISGTVTANLPALNWNTVKIAYGGNDAPIPVWNGIYKKGDAGYVDVTGAGTPQYLPVDGAFFGGVSPQLTRGTYPGGFLSFTGTRWYFEVEGDVQFYATTTATDLRVITDWTDSGGDGANVQITPYSVEPVAIPGGVAISSLPAISGTVTANLAPQANGPILQIDSVIPNDPKYVAIVGGFDVTSGETRALQLAGNGEIIVQTLPAISGTVTAAAPNGSLTTRFGTPVTAGEAFATSAVTKDDRKYLLIQNVTTQSNVITVGIGFTPTTTQGIQLTAGAGITFESSYIPTGAVYVLSSVTASNFTILEA